MSSSTTPSVYNTVGNIRWDKIVALKKTPITRMGEPLLPKEVVLNKMFTVDYTTF